MNNYTNAKIRRTVVVDSQPSHPQKHKHRVILNQSNNRRAEPEGLKSITRKSIDITLPGQVKGQNNTHYQGGAQSKPYYRRVGPNFKKQTTGQRYEEEQRDNQRTSSKSPYVRVSSKLERQLQAKNSTLNRSSNKIRSGQLLKQNSPRYLFYRQPRSSLSQHYDPTVETSLHKRRGSLIGDEKGGALDQAKELYKTNDYGRAIELLKRFLKVHRTSIEGHYLLGMSLINNSDFPQGIDQLLKTLEMDASYKRSLYLVIALAYKRLTKYDQAIQILNKGVELYPDYYDCLVYRGKLHLKKDNYYHALKDFSDAIALNKSKGFAYVGKGVCEKELGHFDQAIQTLTEGSRTDMGNICIQKRGIVYFQQGNLELALKDLDFCSQSQTNTSSTAHYYKGLIFYQQNKTVESLLCFQQSLKCDNHKQNVTASVQMMMRIKIEEKDFYEAYHILTRSDNVEVEGEGLSQWRKFLEGSLFLMKKKYKEGVGMFAGLLSQADFGGKYSSINNKTMQQRYRFLRPLVHLYKGFGQLCESSPSKAQKQYLMYQQLCNQFGQMPQNLSKCYNQLIIKIYANFPKNARQAIQESVHLIPNKPEPYLYLAFEIIQNRLQSESDPVVKGEYLEQAIENLSIGIAHLPQLSNNHISTFYYYRSILYLYRNDFNKAVADVDKAIEKSQDNIPKYFYLRGLIFAVFGNFGQSVQDLTVAINLDQKYAKPYLQRAKCLQIQGNSNQAFLDLQRYITLAPEDQQIHKYAGYLLFQNCAYEDCLSAFSHGTQLQGDLQLMLTKAKCHFLLGEDETAIPLFKRYCDLSYTHEYKSDVVMMEISRSIKEGAESQIYVQGLQRLDKLIASKTEEQCKIFKMRDMHQLKGSLYLLLGEYKPAIRQFSRTIQLFNIQKMKQKQKHFIDDSEQFEDQWSQVQIKYNLSICLLCIHDFNGAKEMLAQFDSSSQKGRNWNMYMVLVDDLIIQKERKKIQLDTFQQNHRISKYWPRIKIPNTEISISMAFSYPFVQPPELLPEFDTSFFDQFVVSKSEMKPQAPWINRSDGGLVFTPNIQTYDNLQLSMTTTKKDESERNKPVSEMDKSMNMSQSDIQLQTQELKRKFKLDSEVEMRLKRLMNKK